MDHYSEAFPRRKRQAYMKIIEEDLRTYRETRRYLDGVLAEVEASAYPVTAWPQSAACGDDARRAVVDSRGSQHSDPTPARAESMARRRKHLLGSAYIQEQIAVCRAIEDVLGYMSRGSQLERMQADAVTQVYIDGRPQSRVRELYCLPVSTWYAWRRRVFEAIAGARGLLVSKKDPVGTKY